MQTDHMELLYYNNDCTDILAIKQNSQFHNTMHVAALYAESEGNYSLRVILDATML